MNFLILSIILSLVSAIVNPNNINKLQRIKALSKFKYGTVFRLKSAKPNGRHDLSYLS